MSLDQNWYSSYFDLLSFDDINFLSTSKAVSQKVDFLDGRIDRPDFEFSINLDQIKDLKGKLLFLRSALEKEEDNPFVKKAYLDKVDEQILKLDMIQAGLLNEDFYNLSVSLYDQPEKDLLDKVAGSIISTINHLKNSGQYENISKSCNLMLAILSDCSSDDSQSFLADKEMESDDFFYGSDYLAQKMKEFLSAEKLDDYFKVVISKDKHSITVDHSTQTIFIPENKKVKERECLGLIAHEIGVHIKRRFNGENSDLKLLGIGLDRYLSAEEGLALFEESKHTPKIPGVGNYLAISLASGFLGQPRDFRQVFEIIRAYHEIMGVALNQNLTKDILNDRAYSFCLRTFRGTNKNSGDGICFTRDLVYFSGFHKMKKLFDENSKEISRLFVGKYDPTNKSHADILDGLKIGC